MSTHELGPLPLSPVEVGDLILQPRKHVEGLGWSNREALYPAFQMRTYALAEVARAVEAERERCAQACERVAYTHAVTSLLGPEQNALKCAAAIREGAR